MGFNYMKELQAITEDYKKAKFVVESTNYVEQLNTAINYCQYLVKYHCCRLGINVKFDHKLRWFFKERNKREKNKIIRYIDSCVDDLQTSVDIKKDSVVPYADYEFIGYGDPSNKSIRKIQEDIKKWNDKKTEEKKDVHRTVERTQLQVN